MSHIALYRKWRPETFDEVVEQAHIVKTLKNAVDNGTFSHAYLFTGTRGTGKTSMAKILARAVNCESPKQGNPCNKCRICRGILAGSILDVIEIDAASNNSVENVRDIRDEVVYTPSDAKYKVYIIDEVHMLSTGAFNALLKTLEEPPAHVIFILATTEPHKLPATIVSRCQKFNFKRISNSGILGRLTDIAETGDIKFTEGALKLISKYARGALRDGINLLDQCVSTGLDEVGARDVQSIAGLFGEDVYIDLLFAVKDKQIKKIAEIIDSIYTKGLDIFHFLLGYTEFIRDMLIYVSTGETDEIYSGEFSDEIKRIKDVFTVDEIIYYIREISRSETNIKLSDNNKIMLEVLLIRLAEGLPSSDTDLADRISILEGKITSAGGIAVELASEKTEYKSTLNKKDSEEKNSKKNDNTPVEKNRTEESFAVDANKDFTEVWDEILNDMKKSGKMVLYSNLIRKRTLLSGDILEIYFESKDSFSKRLIASPENTAYLQDIISKIIDRRIKVKCLDAENNESEEDSYIDDLDKLSKDLGIEFAVDEQESLE